MTDVSALARSVWRNFVTDGVPSSGAHKPLKSDIYGVFDLIAAGNVETLQDIEDLTIRPELVWALGELEVGDGGGGPYRWHAGSSTTPDGKSVLNPDSGEAGRYKRADGRFEIFRDMEIAGPAKAYNSAGFMLGIVTGETSDFTWGLSVINVAESIDNSSGPFGSCLSGLVVNHAVIGAPTTAGQGSRHAIWAILSHNAPTAGLASDGRDFYTGLFSTVAINSGDGGSVGAKKGNFYGLGSIVTAKPAATNLFGVIGAEINVAMETGSSAGEKVLLQLINVNSDAVKGSVIDAAVVIAGDATVTAQFDKGIAFGKTGSKWNVSGDILGTYTTTNSMAAVNGINLTGVAFSGHFLKHDNFSVSQAGGIAAAAPMVITNAFASLGLLQSAGGTGFRFMTPNDGTLVVQRTTDGFAGATTPLTIEADGDAVFAATVQGAAFWVAGNQVLGARDTGWTAMTGSPDEATAYATGSVSLPQLAGRVMALQAALTTHGLIGA